MQDDPGNRVHSFNPIRLIKRARQLYQVGGIPELLRGSKDFSIRQGKRIWRTIPFIPTKSYHDSRVDNEFRWSVIEPWIQSEFETAMDIGCAQGYFSGKAAEQGLEVWAFDTREDRLQQARNRWQDGGNPKFEKRNITSDNVDDLPDSDITFLLAVHHHWIRHFGWNPSLDMLKTVASKTELLIYEMPPANHEFIPEDRKGDISESIQYYTTLIESTFDNSVEILDKKLTQYKGGTREDSLFVLDTSKYQK